jgi:uncharacterized protein
VIVYVDASALVKRYVTEVGSTDVNDLTAGATAVATALVTRAEVAAAFARAVRVGVLDDVAGRSGGSPASGRTSCGSRSPRRWWPGPRPWRGRMGLRGDDAVQLASALTWQDALGQEVVLATFDRQLWEAGPEAGLRAWPTKLPN